MGRYMGYHARDLRSPGEGLEAAHERADHAQRHVADGRPERRDQGLLVQVAADVVRHVRARSGWETVQGY